MSTDSHAEQNHQGDPDSDGKTECECAETTGKVNPLFQEYANEAGRRFREALDRLARFDEGEDRE